MTEIIKIFIALILAFIQQNLYMPQKEVEPEPEQSIVESISEEEEIIEESNYEQKSEPEYTPEQYALSLAQDDYALYIPSLNCEIKVHECDTAEELDLYTSQYYTDLHGMGVDLRYDLAYGEDVFEAYGQKSFIADHSDQGFYGLWNLQHGAKAYVAKNSEVKVYKLTKVYHAYMQYVEYEHVIAQVPVCQGQNLMLGDADLIIMTCAEDSHNGGRYITYWKEV